MIHVRRSLLVLLLLAGLASLAHAGGGQATGSFDENGAPGTDPFTLVNASDPGVRITRVTLDLSTTTDIVFDPFTGGGAFPPSLVDTAGTSGFDGVFSFGGGFIQPLPDPREVFETLELVFSDFDPGEEVAFFVDVDSGDGQLSFVSAAQFAPTTVQVWFSNGCDVVISTDTFADAGSLATFAASASLPDGGAWADLGSALAGSTTPRLVGTGCLQPATTVALALTDALPNSTAALVIGLSALNAPFKGGVLVPDADLVLAGLPTGPGGGFDVNFAWPAGVPSGFVTYFQVWVQDVGGPVGWAASNGTGATAP